MRSMRRRAAHQSRAHLGPGAGKTEMLAQRADFLLRTRPCRYPRPHPRHLNHKIDAAQNLQPQVRQRCGQINGARLG